jgi:tungstate transport system substrate-binding protein
MSRRLIAVLSSLVLLLCVSACFGSKKGKTLRLATTTSVHDSGLLTALLPAFEERSGYRVEVNAVGSGKALELLRSGSADAAITHAPDEEQQAVTAGQAARRTPFMHNELVLVGPKDHASLVAGSSDFREAMRKIAASGRKFISRGDGSGTNKREQALWKAANIAIDSSFIVAAKAGMGETLEKASEDEAFALTDRGTFIAKRGDLDLAIVFQGDDELRNIYAIVEPTKQGDVNADGARALAEFLRSPEGRALIGRFGVEKLGEPLFTPHE